MSGTAEAERRYPERPIYLPDGGAAVVVPTPERKAFVAGAAWQASQSTDAITALRRERDEAIASRDSYLKYTQPAVLRRAEAAERLADRYRAVLEPFARKADAASLSDALGHIERAHLMAARDLVDQLLRAAQDEPHAGGATEPAATYAQLGEVRLMEVRLDDITAMRDEQARLARERDHWKHVAEKLAAGMAQEASSIAAPAPR